MSKQNKKTSEKLFQFPNPLEQKVDATFLSSVPGSPGVYYLENPKGKVVYVGKARNLRSRLERYRKASPLEVTGRQRKILFETNAIRWESCTDVTEARRKQTAAAGALMPPLNPKPLTPEKYRFVHLKFKAYNKRLHMKLVPDPTEIEETDESKVYGAFDDKGALRLVMGSVLRILWFTSEAEKKATNFLAAPAPLFARRTPLEYSVRIEERRFFQLQTYFSGIRGLHFVQELSEHLLPKLSERSFHFEVLLGDFERLVDFYDKTLSYQRRLSRFHKLGKNSVSSEKKEDFSFLEKFRTNQG